MKHCKTNHTPARLLAAMLAAAGAAAALQAAAADLNGQITLRPLTPQEIKDYKLTGAQGASGMDTIGVGQPAYLEVLVNSEIPASEITSVNWTLKQQPIGSTAALTNSPFGAEVPLFNPADRDLYQIAGRTLLLPDMTGRYTVEVTVETAGSGSTNLTQVITAGKYMGIKTCTLCHSGGAGAENMVSSWSETHHASMFTLSIDGIRSDHYGKNCISCHTVGYDTNPMAVNGGFDDVAAQTEWTFPAAFTNGNWAAMPADLKNVANIQCESCHGPGSEHALSLGDTSRISVTHNAGNCAQCHDALTHHFKSAEWKNSKHAIAVREEGSGCVGCHQGPGFADRMKGVAESGRRTEYEAIGCTSCHDPHNAKNPHQLRTLPSVTLMDGTTTITKGGNGLLCMNCHMTRRKAATYAETTAGSSRFGPHHGPQADMLAGANAVTYGKDIPSSAHRDVVEDSCAQCHMQPVVSGEEGFLHAGGHTFRLSHETETNHVELVSACVECHGPTTTFNFKRDDYDGNGVVEGVQTEVKGLLNKLALLLPPVGVSKTTLNMNTNWSRPQLKAAYNYLFVEEDGSFGVHNTAYAVGLLKASIADLTGDGNSDGLPDAWQIQHFGSIGSPNAAPNATPAGDGVPNWLKYSLGLDPMQPGVTVPGGVVWAAGKNVVNPNPGDTDSVRIYTAAEVVFETETGKTYQIQAASTISDGWQNVGTPIQGTGAPISYVTPTRANVQQYYRVVPNP